MGAISNLVATVLGLWLSYAAVLDLPRMRDGAWDVYGAAVIAIALGLLSRRRDFARWPGTTEIVAGVVAIGTLSLFHAGVLNHQVAFWLVFFAGNVISVLALWAALYRPRVT